MSSSRLFFATAPRTLVELLAAELTDLGASSVRMQATGVAFTGDLEFGYRTCLWSRLASRVLMVVGEGPASDSDTLYASAQAIDWSTHLGPQQSLAIDFTGTSETIVHTQFGAQRVKDAIVDQLRDGTLRPSVDLHRPDIRLHVHLHGRPGAETAVFSLDLAGEGLHRRGVRDDSVAAPIKENLAAAVLVRAGWPAVARAGGSLFDPMCGSGTFLIEAAWIAGDRAPGRSREYFGFLGWRGHNPTLWAQLVAEADARAAAGAAAIPAIHGSDDDPAAIAAAARNLERAGVAQSVHLRHIGVGRLAAQAPATEPRPPGLVVTNPPYGVRLASTPELPALYAELGAYLRAHHRGDEAAILLPDPAPGHALGLRAYRRHAFANGSLPVQLLRFRLDDATLAPRPTQPSIRDSHAEALANRLQKNRKQLASWAETAGTDCYRLYDSDIPEYAVAIDLYGAHAHVQEYAPPKTIDPTRAGQRLRDAVAVVSEVLQIPKDHVHLKTRTRSKGGSQYAKPQGRSDGERLIVREGPCKFLVNLTDYLDTGLFLDHRLTRMRVGQLARGRRFLNLFAYTGTATVHAARGGAVATTTVDMSPTYTAWARDNFELNGVTGPAHRIITSECRSFMQHDLRRYGLIFLDPPTFSNSQRMADDFEIQRDHVALIRSAVRLLEPGGILLFSTNFRRFRLEQTALADLALTDITAATIPRDFRRNPRIHQCWQIEVNPR